MSASLVITRLDDLALLRESVALECKLAQGRDRTVPWPMPKAA